MVKGATNRPIINQQRVGLGQQAPKDNKSGLTMNVVAGDNATRIAERNNITLKQLQKANPDQNLNKLKAGQSLNLPDVDKTGKPIGEALTKQLGQVAGMKTHEWEVEKGDNLSNIAKQLGCSLEQLVAAQDGAVTAKNNYRIMPGQMLKIPSSSRFAQEQSALEEKPQTVEPKVHQKIDLPIDTGKGGGAAGLLLGMTKHEEARLQDKTGPSSEQIQHAVENENEMLAATEFEKQQAAKNERMPAAKEALGEFDKALRMSNPEQTMRLLEQHSDKLDDVRELYAEAHKADPFFNTLDKKCNNVAPAGQKYTQKAAMKAHLEGNHAKGRALEFMAHTEGGNDRKAQMALIKDMNGTELRAFGEALQEVKGDKGTTKAFLNEYLKEEFSNIFGKAHGDWNTVDKLLRQLDRADNKH